MTSNNLPHEVWGSHFFSYLADDIHLLFNSIIFVMKKSLSILFLLCFWIVAYAQDKNLLAEKNASGGDLESFRGNKHARLSEGSCANVIEFLRVSQENDSIAIDIFRKEYKITNMRYAEEEWLSKNDYRKIIRFFSQTENRNYYCRSGIAESNDPVLLLDSRSVPR